MNSFFQCILFCFFANATLLNEKAAPHSLPVVTGSYLTCLLLSTEHGRTKRLLTEKARWSFFILDFSLLVWNGIFGLKATESHKAYHPIILKDYNDASKSKIHDFDIDLFSQLPLDSALPEASLLLNPGVYVGLQTGGHGIFYQCSDNTFPSSPLSILLLLIKKNLFNASLFMQTFPRILEINASTLMKKNECIKKNELFNKYLKSLVYDNNNKHGRERDSIKAAARKLSLHLKNDKGTLLYGITQLDITSNPLFRVGTLLIQSYTLYRVDSERSLCTCLGYHEDKIKQMRMMQIPLMPTTNSLKFDSESFVYCLYAKQVSVIGIDGTPVINSNALQLMNTKKGTLLAILLIFSKENFEKRIESMEDNVSPCTQNEDPQFFKKVMQEFAIRSSTKLSGHLQKILFNILMSENEKDRDEDDFI